MYSSHPKSPENATDTNYKNAPTMPQYKAIIGSVAIAVSSVA